MFLLSAAHEIRVVQPNQRAVGSILHHSRAFDATATAIGIAVADDKGAVKYALRSDAVLVPLDDHAAHVQLAESPQYFFQPLAAPVEQVARDHLQGAICVTSSGPKLVIQYHGNRHFGEIDLTTWRFNAQLEDYTPASYIAEWKLFARRGDVDTLLIHRTVPLVAK